MLRTILQGDMQLRLAHLLSAAEFYDVGHWFAAWQASLAAADRSTLVEKLESEKRWRAMAHARMVQSVQREAQMCSIAAERERERLALTGRVDALNTTMRDHGAKAEEAADKLEAMMVASAKDLTSMFREDPAALTGPLATAASRDAGPLFEPFSAHPDSGCTGSLTHRRAALVNVRPCTQRP